MKTLRSYLTVGIRLLCLLYSRVWIEEGDFQFSRLSVTENVKCDGDMLVEDSY